MVKHTQTTQQPLSKGFRFYQISSKDMIKLERMLTCIFVAVGQFYDKRKHSVNGKITDNDMPLNAYVKFFDMVICPSIIVTLYAWKI